MRCKLLLEHVENTIFACERGVDYENGITGGFTDCSFGSIHEDPRILLKRNLFFSFIRQTLQRTLGNACFVEGVILSLIIPNDNLKAIV